MRQAYALQKTWCLLFLVAILAASNAGEISPGGKDEDSLVDLSEHIMQRSFLTKQTSDLSKKAGKQSWKAKHAHFQSLRRKVRVTPRAPKRLTCTCKNGVPAPWPGECKENGPRCVKCDSGYILENLECSKVYKCTCKNGIPQKGSKSCLEDGENCASCNTGFVPKGPLCKEKTLVDCPDGRTDVPTQKKAECEIKGLEAGDEWTFLGYLRQLKCPQYTKEGMKAVMECYVDRNPCKEIELNDLKEAFQLCGKERLEKIEEKLNPDAEQNQEEMPDQKRSQAPLKTRLNEHFNYNLYSAPWKSLAQSWSAHAKEKTRTLSFKHGAKLAPIVKAHGEIGFDSKLSQGVFASDHLGGHVGGKSALFIGNKKGPVFEFPAPTDSRQLVTLPFTATEGGVVSFYLKAGNMEGDPICKREYDVMAREYKRQMRAQAEVNGKKNCEESPPCGGHGEGVFASKCFVKGQFIPGAVDEKRDLYDCHDPKFMKCTCNCEKGYLAPDCRAGTKPNTRDGYRRCRSVGDPHPNTASGANFNIYDAGEFVWSRHQDVAVEARLRTQPRGRVAINRGMSLKVCAGKPFANGKTNDNGKMNGPCETVSMERCSFFLESCDAKGACKCTKISNKYKSKLGIVVTSNTMSVNGWSIQYSCGSYMDSYLTINSPRDGKSEGLCGYYGKNGAGGDTGNAAFLANTGSRGSHHMTSKRFYQGPLTIKKGGDSHFRCAGFIGASMNGKYHFQEIGAGLNTGTKAQMQMKLAEQSLTAEYARMATWSYKRMADPAGDEVSTSVAEKICSETIIKCSGMPVPDVAAMTACVADYVKVGKELGESVLKGACDVVKEDEDNTEEDIKMDEKEEVLEMVSAAPLRVPGRNDLVVQWCAKDCDQDESTECTKAKQRMRETKGKFTPKDVNKVCKWKQMKAYPAKLYEEWITCSPEAMKLIPSKLQATCGFRPMTVSIPPEAIEAQKALKTKIRVRFFQEAHDCYCCNTFAIDSVRINVDGWPVRCQADSSFTLYADGKEVGESSNNWASYQWNPMKDTYRFRVDPNTKVIGAKINANGEGKAGLICSVGESLVTSSTWRCSDDAAQSDPAKYTLPSYDASLWPNAAEIGRNEGEGVLPWGPIPGIASKAFWIYDHRAYSKGKTEAHCRVDTKRAYHSYSITHKAASRWSCKSDMDRQSPFIMQLDDSTMGMAAVLADDSESTQSKPVSVTTSIAAFGGPDRFTPVRGEQGVGTTLIERRRRISFAAYPIDEKKGRYKKQSILLRIKVKKIVAMTTEGAMIKKAKLRLFVTDGSHRPFYYCLTKFPWDASRVTYNEWNRTIFPSYLSDCRKGPPTKSDEFVTLDVSDWMRLWTTNAHSGRGVNGGIAIIFDGGAPERGKETKPDVVAFATTKVGNENAAQRPRLSLSCHGDRVSPTVVFKENRKASTLLKAHVGK
jgi:hypothetical protein